MGALIWEIISIKDLQLLNILQNRPRIWLLLQLQTCSVTDVMGKGIDSLTVPVGPTSNWHATVAMGGDTTRQIVHRLRRLKGTPREKQKEKEEETIQEERQKETKEANCGEKPRARENGVKGEAKEKE